MSAVIKYGTFEGWKYNAFDGGPSATGEAYPLPAVNWTLSQIETLLVLYNLEK